MRLNRRVQITRPPIVKEEDALTQPPQGRCAKFISKCPALIDLIRQSCSHAMNREI